MDDNFLGSVIKFVASLFSGSPEVQVSIPLNSPAPASPGIDWTNPECNITENFKVKDALLLHNWGRLATEADGADFGKLQVLFNKMEEIRGVLGCEIKVHCGFRSQAYNESQGIRPVADVHSMSLAVDFDANEAMTIQQVKDKLEPLLEQLQIRLERGTTTWVHIDLHSVGPSGRYFTA